MTGRRNGVRTPTAEKKLALIILSKANTASQLCYPTNTINSSWVGDNEGGRRLESPTYPQGTTTSVQTSDKIFSNSGSGWQDNIPEILPVSINQELHHIIP